MSSEGFASTVFVFAPIWVEAELHDNNKNSLEFCQFFFHIYKLAVWQSPTTNYTKLGLQTNPSPYKIYGGSEISKVKKRRKHLKLALTFIFVDCMKYVLRINVWKECNSFTICNYFLNNDCLRMARIFHFLARYKDR